MGLTVIEAEPERIVLGLAYRPDLITVGTTIHGGVIATLIDTAAAMASGSGVTDPNVTGGATSALNISYLNAANGKDLTATAIVENRTRRRTVTEIKVHDSDGVLIAKASATSTIFLA